MSSNASSVPKRLVVQADDLGSSHAANAAIFDLAQAGSITSTTVMVVGPWARQALVWGREHPEFPLGLHLTHTSEWDAPRWRPLLGESGVPSLFDEEGYLWREPDTRLTNSDPTELIDESRAQLSFFLRYGNRPAHLDNHMFTMMHDDQSFADYLAWGREVDLPVLVPTWALWNEQRQQAAHGATHALIPKILGLDDGWDAVWDQLEPGLNLLITHPVLDTPEIRTSIPDWEPRFREYRLLSSFDLGEGARRAGVVLAGLNGATRGR